MAVIVVDRTLMPKWHLKLTAAGTAPNSHRIPYYEWPSPLTLYGGEDSKLRSIDPSWYMQNPKELYFHFNHADWCGYICAGFNINK